MATYGELDELFMEKYGEPWERDMLTQEEEEEWVEACYDYWREERELREGYQADGFADGAFDGFPFEIVSEATVDDGHRLRDLPMWYIRVFMEDDCPYPGTLLVHADQIFVED